jgi:hypothetical protein
MSALRSRTLITALVALLLGMGAVGLVATRPPRWQAWPGENAVCVQVDGAAPPPERVRLRGEKGPGHRGTVQGDRLRFAGLTPDTTYWLEWRVGPFTPATLAVTTLPPVLPAVDLDVAPGAGKLALKLRTRDPRFHGVEMQVAAGAQALARTADRFEVPLPPGHGNTELALVLPASQERFALDLPVFGIDLLLEELGRLEADIEPYLGEADNPALLPPAALEPWEPSPMPARRATTTGGPGVLARLRRLAPLVRATAAGDAPLAQRWRLAFAATRLAGAEVLARRHQQPALGVLDWSHDLVRFATAKSTGVRRRSLLAHPAHVAHPEYTRGGLSSVVEVMGGTSDSRLVQFLEVPPLPAPLGAWRGITVVTQAVFNSGPLVLRYPGAGAALELPLMEPSNQLRQYSLSRTFPESALDVWIRRLPPEADWSTITLEPTHRPKSKRISPTFVVGIAALDKPPR